MECKNSYVQGWIQEVAAELTPASIVWVDGSKDQLQKFYAQLVEEKVLTPLNQKEYPNCYWAVSDPTDVARVEERTFICSKSEADAGPTNHWRSPIEMYAMLKGMMQGCMAGRTMYVIPYLMGPAGSPYSRVGFELTDSLFVVVNMAIMARTGEVALKALKDSDKNFVKGVHSKGTIDPERRYIAHFPEDRTIISFNSNYGGNALLGKKCFALRIASAIARDEHWLAEHMLIVGVTTPEKKKYYFAAAFPSACGKTNLAMLIPPEDYVKKGWKVETVGDDIAWLNFGKDGRMYAINPEAGFFGVAPGTSMKTNPNALKTCQSNTLFTNTALNSETMTPWWEGLSEAPAKLIDWHGKEWTKESGTKAAHPNSRFTAPASQCPCIDPNWESPEGVPISGIIFGGRRAKTLPLVFETKDWTHGVYAGVTMASEMTAAAAGTLGALRRDPMAMLPFIGYHAGDYFAHWLSFGKEKDLNLPPIFHVNWFRTDEDGKFMWPGFGDNLRVLEWMIRRIEKTAHGTETPIGVLPDPKDINVSGLGMTPHALEELLSVRREEWLEEIRSQQSYLDSIGSKLPAELKEVRAEIEASLKK